MFYVVLTTAVGVGIYMDNNLIASDGSGGGGVGTTVAVPAS
jgi:hypothetical protein